MKRNMFLCSKPKEPREILNRREAADLLGCSLKFLDNNTRGGIIPHCNIGRRTFYSRERLIDFIKAGK